MTEQVKWYGDDFLKDLRANVPDALFEAAEQFVKEAASRAPVDEGDLRDSAYAGTKDKSTYQAKKNHTKEVKAKEGEAVAGFADFKARWNEFGTVKMSAKPFIRPTLDEAKAQLGDVVAVSLKKKLKK